jgi:hypothetical protein
MKDARRQGSSTPGDGFTTEALNVTNDSPLSPLCDDCSTNGEAFFCRLSAGAPDAADASDSVEEFPKGTVLFNEGQGYCLLTTSLCARTNRRAGGVCRL